jgi:3-methylfumaryl-CoA hydratase
VTILPIPFHIYQKVEERVCVIPWFGAIAVPAYHTWRLLNDHFQALTMMLQQTDYVGENVVTKLAATLGVPIGRTLPALWHWLFFLDPVPTNQLRQDGHRLQGGLIPNDPDLPIRMWAGCRIEFHGNVAIGTTLRRETSLIGNKERQGRTGRLRFITTKHSILSDHGLVIEEEHDFVFRAPGASRAASPLAPPTPSGACVRTITPDEVLLFRFSALTFNAHRIHYDRTYATSVEGYPSLVVHGPLQAILLAGQLEAACPGASMRTFECRGLAPAFVSQKLQLEAWCDADHPFAWTLQTRDPSGTICMQGRAIIQENATEPG